MIWDSIKLLALFINFQFRQTFSLVRFLSLFRCNSYCCSFISSFSGVDGNSKLPQTWNKQQGWWWAAIPRAELYSSRSSAVAVQPNFVFSLCLLFLLLLLLSLAASSLFSFCSFSFSANDTHTFLDKKREKAKVSLKKLICSLSGHGCYCWLWPNWFGSLLLFPFLFLSHLSSQFAWTGNH